MGVVPTQGRVLRYLATLIRVVQSSISGEDAVQAGDIDAG